MRSVAGGAGGILAVPLDLLPRRELLAFRGAFLERRHSGRGRRRRRIEQAVENPLAAEDRRRLGGVRGEQQDASLAEEAAALGRGMRADTRRKPGPMTPGMP